MQFALDWITAHATLVLAALALTSEAIALLPVKPNSITEVLVSLAKSLVNFLADFVSKRPGPPAAGAAALVVCLAGCATINPVICGQGGHLVPPAAAPCAEAFLAAVAAVPGQIAACKVGFTAACIDAVIASGRELTACLPTCATSGARLGVGAPVHVAPNVLRANVIDSLRATGHVAGQ